MKRKPLKFKIAETSACATVYQVYRGKEVVDTIRLWIISGGTPAVSFGDHSFSTRFPEVKKWSNDHWSNGACRYDHQDPDDVRGPTAVDVLPKGQNSLREWYKAHKPLHDTRVARYEQLQPYIRLRSQRFHDEHEAKYFWLSVDLRPNFIGSVHFDSRCLSGVFREGWGWREWNLANDQWRNLATVFNQYHELDAGWEVLTRPEFDEVVKALQKVAA